MKIFFLVLCFLMIGASVVSAVESLGEVAQETNVSKEGTKSMRGAGGIAESSLEQPIVLPETIRKLINTLFHFSSGEPINPHLLILLVAIFGVVVLILQQFIALMPFLSQKWQSFSAAVIITLMASVAGTVRMSALYLQDTGKSFQFLGKSGLLSLFLIVVILIFVYYAVSRALAITRRSGEVSNAEQTGFDAGFHYP